MLIFFVKDTSFGSFTIISMEFFDKPKVDKLKFGFLSWLSSIDFPFGCSEISLMTSDGMYFDRDASCSLLVVGANLVNETSEIEAVLRRNAFYVFLLYNYNKN